MALSISHREQRNVNTLGTATLLYLFVAGQCADIITTVVFLRSTGPTGERAFPHLYEGNPLMKAWLDDGAWADVIALKTLVTIGIVTALLRMAHSTKMIYRVGALAGALVSSAAIWDVVLNNLRLMGAL